MEIGNFFRFNQEETSSVLQYNADNPGEIKNQLEEAGDNIRVSIQSTGQDDTTIKYEVEGVDCDDAEDLKEFFEEII